MHKYEIVIFWDEQDQLFVAAVPELSGCLAQGKTPLEAVKNAGQAIDLWIETAREFGDEIPPPKLRSVTA